MEKQATMAEFMGLAPYPDRADEPESAGEWQERMAREAEGFGVQRWSQGEIYPAIIYVRERFDPWTEPCETGHELLSRSYVLLLDGIEEEYATHADAEEVARALLGSPFLRAQWQQGREFDTAEALDGASNYAAERAEATRTGGNCL